MGFRAALWRAVKLVLLGLLVNFTTGGFVLPLRWGGVLQRIRPLLPRRLGGEAVACAARAGPPLAALLLVGYWAAMKHVVGPPRASPRTWSRRRTCPPSSTGSSLSGHLYRWTKTWDPEGVLSTFPRSRPPLLGLLTGEWLRSSREPRPKAVGFVVGGLVVFALGLLWARRRLCGCFFPVNKNLWSPSFVLLNGGLAAALFGLTWWLVDVHGRRGWTGPFVTYGKNANRRLRRLGGAVGRLGHDPLGRDERRRPDPAGADARAALRELAAADARGVRLRPRERCPLVGVARWMDRRGIYLKV